MSPPALRLWWQPKLSRPPPWAASGARNSKTAMARTSIGGLCSLLAIEKSPARGGAVATDTSFLIGHGRSETIFWNSSSVKALDVVVRTFPSAPAAIERSHEFLAVAFRNSIDFAIDRHGMTRRSHRTEHCDRQ